MLEYSIKIPKNIFSNHKLNDLRTFAGGDIYIIIAYKILLYLSQNEEKISLADTEGETITLLAGIIKETPGNTGVVFRHLIGEDILKRTQCENDDTLPAPSPVTSPEKEKAKRTVFVKPTEEEVMEYILERGDEKFINPERFLDYYETRGWEIKGSKIKDWKACIRTWERKHDEELQKAKPKTRAEMLEDIGRKYNN